MNIKWEKIKEFSDIRYERGFNDAAGIVKITIKYGMFTIQTFDYIHGIFP